MIPRSAARASGATKSRSERRRSPRTDASSLLPSPSPRSARSSCAARANIRNRKRKKARQGRNYRHEKRVHRHAARRRTGQPPVRPDGEHGKARRPVRREVPHHRLSPVQLRELRHRHRRRAHAVPARWSSTATSATASPGTWTARTAAYTSCPPYSEREGRDVVQGHGQRHLPEHRLRGYVRSRTTCSFSPATTSTRWTTPPCSRTTSECDADCTIAVMEVPLGRGEPLRHHERRRARTPSRSSRKSRKQPKSNLASMGIYVFYVEEAARLSHRGRERRGLEQ